MSMAARIVPKEEVERRESVAKIIEQTANRICDEFCQYRETTDEDFACEWIQQGNDCPLDVLM